MYPLSDQQIDYIVSDIRSRGIVTESLVENLTDHVCCILENELRDGSDFIKEYERTIGDFCSGSLSEIEKETQLLLTFKNYYAMKKMMIYSGMLSAFMMVAGIVLKFMALPGASAGIVLGIGIFSFIFLPLMTILKLRDQSAPHNALLILSGSIAGCLFALGTLFKIMYWPWANMLGVLAIGVLGLIYLPLYFVNGIRKPESKTDTIVTSIIILTFLGLILTLVRSPKGTHKMEMQQSRSYLDHELMLSNEIHLLSKSGDLQSMMSADEKAAFKACEKMKELVIHMETGSDVLPEAIKAGEEPLGDSAFGKIVNDDSTAAAQMDLVKYYVSRLNEPRKGQPSGMQIKSYVFDRGEYRTVDLLNELVRIQLMVLQHVRDNAC